MPSYTLQPFPMFQSCKCPCLAAVTQIRNLQGAQPSISEPSIPNSKTRFDLQLKAMPMPMSPV